MRAGLSTHAYERYQTRVGQADRDELRRELQTAIDNREYSTQRKRSLTCINQVWWGTHWTRTEVVFETCYGLTDYDLPVALAWADKERDQVSLGVLYDT